MTLLCVCVRERGDERDKEREGGGYIRYPPRIQYMLHMWCNECPMTDVKCDIRMSFQTIIKLCRWCFELWLWRSSYRLEMNKLHNIIILVSLAIGFRCTHCYSVGHTNTVSPNKTRRARKGVNQSLSFHSISIKSHPASSTMGIGGLFPRGKGRPGRDVDHSALLVPR
jgi:hypothetical protein